MIVEQILKNAPNPLLHIADVSGSALFQGDCLDIMPLIPDKSVQLILADLPYGTTACKWDSIIDLDLIWKQYKRIIKDNGAIVLTASQPFTTKLISSNYEMFKYEWIWNKINGSNFMNIKNRPFKTQENILVFSKTANFIFNPQRVYRTEKSLKRDKIGVEASRDLFSVDIEHYGAKRSNKLKLSADGKKHPIDIITFSIHEKGRYKIKHPTKKPLELMKYLISTYTNENDMVLDNTMGSGTTCLAAKELNRKFIGIEKEANYYEIACRRCGF
jgi:site-specific DNA-methyltransferase (adenine-specific)